MIDTSYTAELLFFLCPLTKSPPPQPKQIIFSIYETNESLYTMFYCLSLSGYKCRLSCHVIEMLTLNWNLRTCILMKTLSWIIWWKHKFIFCKIIDIDNLINSKKLYCSVWIKIKNWIELNLYSSTIWNLTTAHGNKENENDKTFFFLD